MKDIQYTVIKMEPYLELKEMTARQAKVWFKFRVRMALLCENFRGGVDIYGPPLLPPSR